MNLAYSIPILPGQTPRARDQAKEYEDHKERYEELNAEATVSRHSVWVQETPMGDFETSLLILADPTKMRMTFESDDYDAWWLGFMREVHGMDPVEQSKDFKVPVQILDNASATAGSDRSLGLVLPVLPGKADELKSLAGEVSGARKVEHDEMLATLGLDGEAWFLQESPMGDAAIVYFEGADIGGSFVAFGSLQGDYPEWFRGRLLEVSGIDWTQPSPALPELVFDWRA